MSAAELCDRDFLEPVLAQLIAKEDDLLSLTPKVIYAKLAQHLQIETEIITGTPETKQFVKTLAAEVARRIQKERSLVKGDEKRKSSASSPASPDEFKRVRKATTTTKVKRVESRKEQLRNIVKRMKCGPSVYKNMPKGDDVAYVVELENRIRQKCQELKIPCSSTGLPELGAIARRMKEIELEEELSSIGLKPWEEENNSNATRRRRRAASSPDTDTVTQKRRRTEDKSLVNGDETFKGDSDLVSESESVSDLEPTPSDSEEEEEESEFNESDLSDDDDDDDVASD